VIEKTEVNRTCFVEKKVKNFYPLLVDEMQEESIKRTRKSWMRKKKNSCEKKEISWSFLLSFFENIFILSVYIFCCMFFPLKYKALN